MRMHHYLQVLDALLLCTFCLELFKKGKGYPFHYGYPFPQIVEKQTRQLQSSELGRF